MKFCTGRRPETLILNRGASTIERTESFENELDDILESYLAVDFNEDFQVNNIKNTTSEEANTLDSFISLFRRQEEAYVEQAKHFKTEPD